MPTIFRWADLPAEVRNMIYSLLLEEDADTVIFPAVALRTNPHGIYRFPAAALFSEVIARPNRFPPRPRCRALAPHFLRVSRRIHHEGSVFLYRRLAFHGIQVMSVFLDLIDRRHLPYLRHITLHGWSNEDSRIGVDRHAWSTLRHAPNLTTVRLEGIQRDPVSPRRLALGIHQHANLLVKHLEGKTGKRDAILDLLHLPFPEKIISSPEYMVVDGRNIPVRDHTLLDREGLSVLRGILQECFEDAMKRVIRDARDEQRVQAGKNETARIKRQIRKAVLR